MKLIKSFIDLLLKKEDKRAFAVAARILVVCLSLTILLLAIIIYSANLNKKEKLQEQSQNDSKAITTVVYDHDKLVADYKAGVNSALDKFNGNYEVLKNNLTAIDVPQEYQTLHFNLVVSLDKVVYENDKQSALDKFNEIKKANDWIGVGLDKVIESLKTN